MPVSRVSSLWRFSAQQRPQREFLPLHQMDFIQIFTFVVFSNAPPTQHPTFSTQTGLKNNDPVLNPSPLLENHNYQNPAFCTLAQLYSSKHEYNMYFCTDKRNKTKMLKAKQPNKSVCSFSCFLMTKISINQMLSTIITPFVLGWLLLYFLHLPLFFLKGPCVGWGCYLWLVCASGHTHTRTHTFTG